MNNKAYLIEIIISVVLISILILMLSPTGLLMPSNFEMLLPVLLIIVFLGFTSLFWRERPQDEREAVHQVNAGRFSFYAGSVVLIVGIVVQSFHHNVDPWLVSALVVMVLAKTISRIKDQLRN